jgi:uncharacterized membrane protein YcfT
MIQKKMNIITIYNISINLYRIEFHHLIRFVISWSEESDLFCAVFTNEMFEIIKGKVFREKAVLVFFIFWRNQNRERPEIFVFSLRIICMK